MSKEAVNQTELVAIVVFQYNPEKTYKYQITHNQYKRYQKVKDVRNTVYATVRTKYDKFPVTVLIRSIRPPIPEDNFPELKRIYGIVM